MTLNQKLSEAPLSQTLCILVCVTCKEATELGGPRGAVGGSGGP